MTISSRTVQPTRATTAVTSRMEPAAWSASVRRIPSKGGYRVPDASAPAGNALIGATLFANLTEDEREELLEYLAWYRTRRRSRADAARRH